MRTLPILVAAWLFVGARIALAVPANDACVDATIVAPATRLHETIDTASATTDVDDPAQSCTAGGPSQNSHSIWYRMTPPTDGILSAYTLNTVFPADPPTVVSVHTGACGSLAEVDCYDSPTDVSSYLHTAVTGGTTYWIAITSDAGSPGGAVEVRIYFDPDSPLCPHDAGDFAEKSSLTFARADGRVQLNARAFLAAPMPDVAARGFQLLVEDWNASYAPTVEWSYRTLPVPPGTVGTGCHPNDGWTAAATGRSHRYRNVSNAVPPACTPGSANGLTDVRVKQRPNDPSVVDVKVRTRGTAFASLTDVDAVRVSLTLDATVGPTNRERCAASYFPFRCRPNGSGSKVVCKY